MRTTLIIDENLFRQASELTGITEKTKLLHEGLKSIIRRESALFLANIGGSDKKASIPDRRAKQKLMTKISHKRK